MAADGIRFREALAGDPTALEDAMRANVDPVHQCQAMTTYRDTVLEHVVGRTLLRVAPPRSR